MPYVTRDSLGRVAALSLEAPAPGAECLPPSHPDVLGFLLAGGEAEAPDDPALRRFLASDLALIRVVEDLVAVLIEKRLIAITDLPPAAQDKLLDRRALRSYLAGVAGMPDPGSESADAGAKVI